MTFVLADCNNFYVSCERLFNPRLKKRAVIVLSNNDGIVVARSQEAKDLGIAMGEVFFKIRDLCERQRVVVYSSNYQLYGDISGRVMEMLRSMAPEMQIYSIDEAFLQFSDAGPERLFDDCIQMRGKILQWVGIPVSFGIGPTKTLAKAGNKMAKKKKDGVFDMRSTDVQEEVLAKFPIRDIWGIGRRWEEKLKGFGIFTAKQLREQDLPFIRKQMGVVGERIVLELRGTSCLELEEAEPNQSIMCSRSFGRAVTEESDLKEALATHAASACVKLREQESCAQAICTYLEAQTDNKTGERQSYSAIVSFPLPTSDAPEVIRAAHECLHHLFREKQFYKKCGVILLDLIAESAVIPDLFLGSSDPKRRRLAEAVDTVNASRGKNTLFYGAMGINPQWKMRSENRSPRYTTSWDELPIVKA